MDTLIQCTLDRAADFEKEGLSKDAAHIAAAILELADAVYDLQREPLKVTVDQ